MTLPVELTILDVGRSVVLTSIAEIDIAAMYHRNEKNHFEEQRTFTL